MQSLWLLFDELIQIPVRGQRQKLHKLLIGNNLVEQFGSFVKLARGVLLLSKRALDLLKFLRGQLAEKFDGHFAAI